MSLGLLCSYDSSDEEEEEEKKDEKNENTPSVISKQSATESKKPHSLSIEKCPRTANSPLKRTFNELSDYPPGTEPPEAKVWNLSSLADRQEAAQAVPSVGPRHNPELLHSISSQSQEAVIIGSLHHYESAGPETLADGGQPGCNDSQRDWEEVVASGDGSAEDEPAAEVAVSLGPVGKRKKTSSDFPGIGRRELEKLKHAVWTDVTTEVVPEAERPVLTYNTPLPFPYQVPMSSSSSTDGASGSQQKHSLSEYDYVSYVTAYQEYLQSYFQIHPSDPTYADFMAHYAGWYGQNGQFPMSAPPVPQIKQKSFEELLEQDRQLSEFFNTPGPNEYICQRSAFKSSFRGTKTYRLNNKVYNPKHFNQLSQGAEAYAKTFPKSKTSLVDRNRHVPESHLPKKMDPVSQRCLKKALWMKKRTL